MEYTFPRIPLKLVLPSDMPAIHYVLNYSVVPTVEGMTTNRRETELVGHFTIKINYCGVKEDGTANQAAGNCGCFFEGLQMMSCGLLGETEGEANQVQGLLAKSKPYSWEWKENIHTYIEAGNRFRMPVVLKVKDCKCKPIEKRVLSGYLTLCLTGS